MGEAYHMEHLGEGNCDHPDHAIRMDSFVRGCDYDERAQCLQCGTMIAWRIVQKKYSMQLPEWVKKNMGSDPYIDDTVGIREEDYDKRSSSRS